MTLDAFIRDLVTLFVVIDPIGTVPVFLAATIGFTAAERKRIALRAIIVSTLVLLFFLVAGQFLLEAMRIELAAFQIAGGIVLFLFALTMIFHAPTEVPEEGTPMRRTGDRAVFPVAMPSIASPGAMLAVVILTDNNRYSAPEQAVTAVALLIVLAVTYLFLRTAPAIHRLIGSSGENIVSRVMGMLLAGVAVSNTLSAITSYFGLTVAT